MLFFSDNSLLCPTINNGHKFSEYVFLSQYHFGWLCSGYGLCELIGCTTSNQVNFRCANVFFDVGQEAKTLGVEKF